MWILGGGEEWLRFPISQPPLTSQEVVLERGVRHPALCAVEHPVL